MRRALLFAFGVVLIVAGVLPSEARSRCGSDRTAGRLGWCFIDSTTAAVAGWGGAWFSFAMADAGYLGLDEVLTLQEAVPTVGVTLSGNYIAASGDGGMWPGSTGSWTGSTGTIAFTQTTVCPSGPSCTTEDVVRSSGTSARLTTATTSTIGDMAGQSMLGCLLFRANDVTTASRIAAKGVGGDLQWEFLINATNFQTIVYKAGGGSTTASKSPAVVGALHLGCGYYESLGDGTSKLTSYLDGVAGTTSTTAVGPIRAANASSAVSWMGSHVDGTRVHGDHLGFFVTASTLTTAQATTAIAALATAVLASNPRGVTSDGDAGLSETFVRATVANCPLNLSTTNGAISMLPSGRPCVTLGGQLSERAGTELALRTNEFSNAAWVDFVDGGAVAPVRVADQAIGPQGALVADRVTFGATDGTQVSGLSQAILSAVAHTGQVYARGQAGDAGSIDLAIEVEGGIVCTPVNYTTAAWTPTKLENVTSIASGKFLIGNLGGLCDGGTRQAADVLLAVADVKTGAYGTTPVPATSAAATRNATVASFAPLTFAGATHSIGALVTPEGLQSGNTYFEAGTNAANYLRGYTDGTSLLCTNAINGALTTATAPGALVVGSAQRVSCEWDGGVTACLAGACASAADAGTLWSGAGTLWLGTRNTTGNEADAVVGALCDDALLRCAP